ncbi:hypothetical protein AVEN_110524-1 [Araneus ventricosus]|uniref:DUF4806 domain-containing protein n=1 Tax=Araneus ventricosus TaxID=182803 RepID=A0A4Y2GUL5_ARAVE|nr:hypothetical protein AVEN_110524-1 [Araneus ventricosus]
MKSALKVLSPARAFLKCTKNHNGYFGCEKCCQKGKWDNNRMTFPDSNAPKRKDSDFYSFSHDDDSGHILEKSPLLKVDIGLVTQFPLDYMHMDCLGVMRKLLISWCRGPLNVRLCSKDIDILSNRLVSYSRNTPDELPRKPRSLKEIDRWKATEFRMFLLYLGPAVLKKVLPSNRYNHFLILHVAIRILCNEVTIRDNLSFAKELLLKFVKKSKCIYGSDFIVYNVHNLIHLGDDVEKFGPLDSFSTYSFENYLAFQRRVFHLLEEIKEEQKELRAMFASNFSKGKHNTELSPDCPRLPCTSPEELASLNTYLEDTKNFSLMCKHFGFVGGSTMNNVVRRILQSILSNSLTSVREHSTFEKTTDHEVENSVKKWLVYAKDREGADPIE